MSRKSFDQYQVSIRVCDAVKTKIDRLGPKYCQ